MEALHKKAAIHKSFNKIGKANGSAAPESSQNTFGIAYEFFVADELRRAANARYDAAKQSAFDAGIIDEEKAIEGAEVNVAEYELFNITMKKAKGSLSLDKVAMKSWLMREYNLDDKTAQAVIDKNSKPRKGAVTIGFAVK